MLRGYKQRVYISFKKLELERREECCPEGEEREAQRMVWLIWSVVCDVFYSRLPMKTSVKPTLLTWTLGTGQIRDMCYRVSVGGSRG